MSLPRRKRKKKASSTFLKDPLESIVVHIGKIFDNATPSQMVDVALNLGLVYVGCDTFGWTPESALVGPVALRLAQSGNLVSGASGVIGLASIGVARLAPSLLDDLAKKILDVFDVQPEVDAWMRKNNPNARWGGVAGYNFHKVESILTACPLIPYARNITFPVYGGLFRACVAVDASTPGGANGPVDGGNGGVNGIPTPPPPPPTDWTYGPIQPGGWRCATCNICGAEECTWTAGTLASAIASHMTIHQGGGGIE